MNTDTQQEFDALIRQTVALARQQLKGSIGEVAAYASDRSQWLAAYVDAPNFPEMAAKEARNVRAKLAEEMVDRADSTDAQILNVIHQAMMIGAKSLAAAL